MTQEQKFIDHLQTDSSFALLLLDWSVFKMDNAGVNFKFIMAIF